MVSQMYKVGEAMGRVQLLILEVLKGSSCFDPLPSEAAVASSSQASLGLCGGKLAPSFLGFEVCRYLGFSFLWGAEIANKSMCFPSFKFFRHLEGILSCSLWSSISVSSTVVCVFVDIEINVYRYFNL